MRIIRRAQNVKFQSLSQSRNPPDQRAAQQSRGVCYPFALKHGSPDCRAHRPTQRWRSGVSLLRDLHRRQGAAAAPLAAARPRQAAGCPRSLRLAGASLVCCSSASERCPRTSASSRVRASSCFFNSLSELGLLLTRAFAFVPVERSLRPRVALFAPLRDKVTSSAQSLVPPCAHRRLRTAQESYSP